MSTTPEQELQWAEQDLRIARDNLIAADRRLEEVRGQFNAAAIALNDASGSLGTETPFGECGCGSTGCGVCNTEHRCWCVRCNPGAWWMVTCGRCGDKRCPGAVDHQQLCRVT